MGQRASAAVFKANSCATRSFNRVTSPSPFRTAFCLHSQETQTKRWKRLRKRWLPKYEIKSTTSAYREQSNVSQKKILVVDDDPDVRLGLQLRLTANHYDVIFAADGVTSIAEARKHMPDLMILDLGLPAGDGFSVLERLKANEKLSSIPVIVLSGRDRVGNRDRAIKAGARTFLQKPMGNEKFLGVIRLILEEREETPEVVYDLAGPS